MSSSVNNSMFCGVNKSTQLEPFVELAFPVTGTALPADHGYGEYAALLQKIPGLRDDPDISLLTIPGLPDKQGKIFLGKFSKLRIRVPISKIPMVYGLAGSRLRIGIHEITLGIPQASVLQPANQLRSRIVVIKGYQEPESFLTAVQRQMDTLGISSGVATIPLAQDQQPSRKTIKIKRYTVVGFSVVISDLNPEDSILLQERGIGGKRHLGCGIFLPWRTRG